VTERGTLLCIQKDSMSQSGKPLAEIPIATSRKLQETSKWKSGPPVWLGSPGVVAPQKGEKWAKRIPPKAVESDGSAPENEEHDGESAAGVQPPTETTGRAPTPASDASETASQIIGADVAPGSAPETLPADAKGGLEGAMFSEDAAATSDSVPEPLPAEGGGTSEETAKVPKPHPADAEGASMGESTQASEPPEMSDIPEEALRKPLVS